ncbi:hypothetical protein F5883DRAFT_70874 [Diaporthe sp. PMI_573]|nr:hypothetical protein F5883DRAFT_70874 [Diaporthaceae sp. PMI_573]
MHSGISLLVYLFSLMALGVPVALVSIRLSPVSIQHLLTVMKAQAVVASPLLISKVERAFGTSSFVYGMGATKVLAAAGFENFLPPQGNDDAIPVDIDIGEPGHYVSESDRNVLILHTSGTTGLPSLVYQSHKMLLGYASCHRRTGTEDVQGLNLSMLPLYHGFGLVVACLALGVGKPVLLPPPNRIPTAISTIELVRSFGPKSLTTVPVILEGISKLPGGEGVAPLLALQYVAYGGGPLDHEVGDHLSKQGIKLLSHFGSTETGPLSPFMVPPSGRSWRYWPLRSDIDIEVEAVDSGAEGLPGERQLYKFSVTPFGWDRPFALQDWFAKDKSSAMYEAVARQDDLIVLSNGYKVQPMILESVICKVDLVGAALVFGEGRSELGVLIEPARPPENISGFKRVLWPAIQDACRQMDDHSRLSSLARIVVLGPGQSLPRSDKGSVLRREAYRCFKQEIQKSYSDALDTEAQPVFKLGENSLENTLREIIRSELGNGSQLNPDDDFAGWGINSMQAALIRKSLIRRLGGSSDLLPASQITTDLVYRNTTIKGLARALRTRQQASGRVDEEDSKIEAFVQRFSLLRDNRDLVILLTGSTGSLGSWVLSHLVARPEVARVICIVRSRPGQSQHLLRRQVEAVERSGATMLPHLWSKIALVEAGQEADPAGKRLGLSDEDYKTLCSRVTHILHAAWPMNFQMPLESFESQFAILQGLLQLARDIHSTRPSIRPRLLFTSSVAVVGNYEEVHGIRTVPEQRVTDNRCSIDLGYSRAKLVCEHILASAADTWHSEMEVSCVRVGQLSGAETNGYWNEKEHFPLMVKLSQTIHAFPRLHGVRFLLPGW